MRKYTLFDRTTAEEIEADMNTMAIFKALVRSELKTVVQSERLQGSTGSTSTFCEFRNLLSWNP